MLLDLLSASQSQAASLGSVHHTCLLCNSPLSSSFSFAPLLPGAETGRIPFHLPPLVLSFVCRFNAFLCHTQPFFELILRSINKFRVKEVLIAG